MSKAPTKQRKAYTAKYNSDNYDCFHLRIRKGTNLADRLADFTLHGEVSINFLINALLCDYFEIGLVHHKYCLKRRTPLWPVSFDDILNEQSPSGGP